MWGLEKNVQTCVEKNKKDLKISKSMEKNPKINKGRAFNKAIGPGTNPILINVGPTSIWESRVLANWSHEMVQNCQIVPYLAVPYRQVGEQIKI
jgi:hypothetical protein